MEIFYSHGRISFANNLAYVCIVGTDLVSIKTYSLFNFFSNQIENVDEFHVFQSSSIIKRVYRKSTYTHHFYMPGEMYVVGRQVYYFIYGPEVSALYVLLHSVAPHKMSFTCVLSTLS